MLLSGTHPHFIELVRRFSAEGHARVDQGLIEVKMRVRSDGNVDQFVDAYCYLKILKSLLQSKIL